ncbi:MAG: hypothetical protein NXH97_11445 [Rhodobacteraceae bacterium]|nr:hypothetical protein [Paracoccaceae bacterium]
MARLTLDLGKGRTMRTPTLAGLVKAWAVAFALMLAPGLAHACPVCIDVPERTVADHALEDWIVVLARGDSGNPFRFAPVEILRGTQHDIADAPEIPFLVDAATRRAMARNPDLSVLLTYGPPADYTGRTPGSGLWYRHVTINPDRRAVLENVLNDGALWDWGMTTDQARFDFFAARITDPDPVVQRMALTEISRAPYAMIRKIDRAPATDELLQRLTRVTAIPLTPITILLLGLDDSPTAEAAVRRGFDRALAGAGTSIGAWIVAGIERGGAAALAQATARLRDAPEMSFENRRDILAALTVTGTARPDLRPAIASALVETVERHPDHAGDLAYSFYTWKDWSILPLYSAMLEGELDHDTRYILGIVVATGRAEQAVPLNAGDL